MTPTFSHTQNAPEEVLFQFTMINAMIAGGLEQNTQFDEKPKRIGAKDFTNCCKNAFLEAVP